MGCHFLLQCMKVKSESEVTQSCLTLHDPMDCSLPGSSVHGIFQAKVLEWDAIAYFCFIDYAKAFDSVDHNKMWKILQEMRIPDHLTCLMRNLYAGQEAAIRMGHGTIDWFQLGKGVCQAVYCQLCLFTLYAEFSSVQSLSCVRLFVTPSTAGCQASLSITDSQSLLKLMSIESVMPSNHLIISSPVFLPPSIFLSTRVFSNESALHIRWPKYRSFSFSISPFNEYSGLISFKMDWLDLLAVQGILKSLLQTTVQKHQLFGAKLALSSNSHTHT